jgi:hypothetical protein
VHIGQPVDPVLNGDGQPQLPCIPPQLTLIHAVGMAAYRKEKFQAYEILGSALDPAAQLTTTTLTVKELLAPLSREDIKTVRCLGLNYADHAVGPIP